MISSGWSVLGLGIAGNLSKVPVLGGVNTERGSVGSFLRSLRRAPTPGDFGVGGSATALMVVLGITVVVESGEEEGEDDERGSGEWRGEGEEAYILGERALARSITIISSVRLQRSPALSHSLSRCPPRHHLLSTTGQRFEQTITIVHGQRGARLAPERNLWEESRK